MLQVPLLLAGPGPVALLCSGPRSHPRELAIVQVADRGFSKQRARGLATEKNRQSGDSFDGCELRSQRKPVTRAAPASRHDVPPRVSVPHEPTRTLISSSIKPAALGMDPLVGGRGFYIAAVLLENPRARRRSDTRVSRIRIQASEPIAR